MNEHGPILVPLDGSELAEGALPMAAEMARAERTHLVLLSVWEPPGSALAPAVSMEIEERAPGLLPDVPGRRARQAAATSRSGTSSAAATRVTRYLPRPRSWAHG